MTSATAPRLPGRTVLKSHSLPAPRFRYSPIVRGAGCIYVSGLVGLDPATGALADGAAAQTRQVLDNFLALCREHGWRLDQLLQARVYCSPAASTADVNAAWNDAFAHVEPPARTFVTAHALPLDAAVEIEFVLIDA
ncbi:RidA family protein [Sphaerotilus montanus]|uniref:2-iminobutanoate/2-iminopropanoate deaminase n=1 Tax=Sphaerotilus montanus TaxID=522889 RepID=A0A7Y9U7L4_9BURK|nr:RidA family protein [Sphaerotilus montanus]NYG35263.1 2-iminobutanoate/2-iminopropanoate deaminase [Sphaerotilus montanus]NZD58394.1 RidA family protein [Sphaerotilus montanus]